MGAFSLRVGLMLFRDVIAEKLTSAQHEARTMSGWLLRENRAAISDVS
jgi:hypothetical protein